ncbi:protein-tyrosine-phosphatase PTP1-like isoform X2 [Andrographis paniculata]|nr:protein-tyrosine-phosphatase PTP1-like isoform X2 [Andrographis paniculata]XP_051139766.1 protein-tyrosine-phosphatase PTP1-like isoform X2 [Andrographis paniculata]XP_051139767.1 protein-tyrosine-phosphatase PTP1-like isoform X2 [Andrographis paniculata]XP_051139768.1 protein-tyrosine-phosphatase PTP1-like isoform X2 [Andrographis paniculata]
MRCWQGEEPPPDSALNTTQCPEWPDDGVVALMINARSYRLSDTEPLIVHISAGVGRTGTVILRCVVVPVGVGDMSNLDQTLELDLSRCTERPR